MITRGRNINTIDALHERRFERAQQMNLPSNACKGPLDAQTLNAQAAEGDRAREKLSSVSCFAFLLCKLRNFRQQSTSFDKLKDAEDRSAQSNQLNTLTKRMLGVRKDSSTRMVVHETEQSQSGDVGGMYKLETVLERLNKKRESVQKEYDKKKEKAMRLSQSGMRNEALSTMRTCKMLESQLKSLGHNCDVVMSQIVTLGNLEMQQEVASVMSTSIEHAKKANKTLDQVTQMEDGLLEAKDTQEEIESAMGNLAQNLLPGSLDDDELLQELDNLCASKAEIDPTKSQEFPAVPLALPTTTDAQVAPTTQSVAHAQAATL